jgi:hypothetical protein
MLFGDRYKDDALELDTEDVETFNERVESLEERLGRDLSDFAKRYPELGRPRGQTSCPPYKGI